jgi:lipopolysaccharide transport system ATP-binding protein
MSNPIVIKAEHITKLYRLGEIGTGTVSRDLERWFARVRGREDPFLKIGETNDRSKKGGSDIVYSLQDINFEIPQGEAVGIIGRNGAGKSTLLKVLSRVTSPTAGTIKIKGRVASLLEVGTGFHPELTGRENVYLNGAILGMRKKEIDRKFDQIVDFSGVERYIDTPVKRYSSGMYVRLAFAVAAHLDAEILVVDEVLAVGDAEFQNKCLGKMSEVTHGEGRTVLFVSHNMAAIKNLCDKTIVLQNGLVQFHGGVADGIKKYLNSTAHVQENYKIDGLLNNDSVDELIVWKTMEITQSETKTSEIHSDERFEVKISYQLKNDVVGFRLFLSLENNEEICLLKSFFDEANNWGSSMQAGVYESIVSIPADLLLEGRYVIKIFGTIHNIRMLNPLAGLNYFFDVFQTGKISRKQFPDDFKGMLTIPLHWNTKTITN